MSITIAMSKTADGKMLIEELNAPYRTRLLQGVQKKREVERLWVEGKHYRHGDNDRIHLVDSSGAWSIAAGEVYPKETVDLAIEHLSEAARRFGECKQQVESYQPMTLTILI